MSEPGERRTPETYDALTMAEMDNDRDTITGSSAKVARGRRCERDRYSESVWDALFL